jgi:antitoxin (DNA-binding transcriptional repressor) of toxin-antitoxin stability system
VGWGWLGVGSIEIGVRELHRQTAAVLERIRVDGHCAIVCRHRRPVAVLVPIAQAQAWVMLHRPLTSGDELLDDDSLWHIEDGVRVAPGAEEALEGMPEQPRRRLLTRLRKLRGLEATGRLAIRVGAWWALADLNGLAETPTVLQVARRAELDRWLAAPDSAVQPM